MGCDVRCPPRYLGAMAQPATILLLSLAIEGLYRPLWSSEILAELEYHETQKLINRGEQPDAAAARARHLIDQMTTAFDDALVENWVPHDGTFNLPDSDDEHVAATT
jgi:PIN domain